MKPTELYAAPQVCDFKKLLENNSLIKNDKSFWVPPFFKKAAFFEAF